MKKKAFFTMLAVVLVLVLSLTVFVACNKDKKDNTGETPATYSVTVNGGTGGGEYTAGATVKITANAPATGKEFTSWTIEGVTVDDKTKAEITFTMPANAVTATANYGDKAYLFALENCTADKESAKAGEQVTFTAGEYEGKRFTGWYIKGVDTTGLDLTKSPLTITMPANDINVAAQLEQLYKITVLGGCTADKEWAAEGEQVTVTKPTPPEGHAFYWWSTGITQDWSNRENTVTFTMPAGDVQISASRVLLNYLFTMVGGTATGVKSHEPNTVTDGRSDGFDYGTDVTITANAPETGKRFTGWTITGVDTSELVLTNEELTFTMPANAVTATANYDFEDYAIKVTGGWAQVNDGGPSDIYAAHYGDNVKIKAFTPETGKKFTGWTITGVDTSELVLTDRELTFTMPAGNVTATANYDFESYEIKVTGGAAQVNDGGPFSTNAAHYGDNVKIKAHNPGTGMEFKNWTITGVDTSELVLTNEELTFTMPANAVTATANYDFINYTVSVTGGTANKTTAHYGEEVTITAEVPVGKDFVMWSFEGFAPDGLTLTDKELTFTMPANAVTATAVFEDINYEVKVICRNIETKTAHYGEEVTITAENIEGKIFVRWEITGLDTEGLDLTRAELSFTMPANNVTAKAIYKELITLTFEGSTAQSEELRYKDNDSKSFRLPLGSGQDLCTYTIELSNSAFTFKVYGSDGEVVPYDNGDGVMCIDINRDDNYTIEVINTGTAANCTLTVTKV